MKDGLLTDAYTSKLTDMAELLESYSANDDGWKKKLQEQIGQKCMKKAGFELCGISDGTVLKTDEDKRSFEERNMDRIDENMRALAQELSIKPQTMLSHVLDYKIIL